MEGFQNTGVKVAKLMLERKHQMEAEVLWEYKNNPATQKAVEKLKKRNELRGTPVISN